MFITLHIDFIIFIFFLLHCTRLTWITCHLEYINSNSSTKELITFIIKIDFYFITHIFILFFCSEIRWGYVIEMYF